MGVPNWLLKIVMAFLSERELIVRYKGKTSGNKSLPGGTPQGTRLEMFLFLILINWAGFEESELEHAEAELCQLLRLSFLENLELCKCEK